MSDILYKYKKILIEDYNLDIRSIIKNLDSTDGNVFNIETYNYQYILKVYDAKEHAMNMENTYDLLKENRLDSPQIIRNKYNQPFTNFKNTYLMLYSFINGSSLFNISLSKKVIINVAQYLRKMHDVKINELKLPVVPFKVPEGKNSLLHFDITKGNIFIENDKIILIDFDDAKVGPALCDVAIALTNLFISRKNGTDINGINIFLDTYYKNNIEQRQLEEPIIKNIATEWLKYTLKNPKLDKKTIDGLENKLLWIEKIF